MKFMTVTDLLRAVCLAQGKWGMYVRVDNDHGFAAAVKNAPYLNCTAGRDLFLDGSGYLLFNTREEMDAAFNVTKVDNVEHGVYAFTVSPEGKILSENT